MKPFHYYWKTLFNKSEALVMLRGGIRYGTRVRLREVPNPSKPIEHLVLNKIYEVLGRFDPDSAVEKEPEFIFGDFIAAIWGVDTGSEEALKKEMHPIIQERANDVYNTAIKFGLTCTRPIEYIWNAGLGGTPDPLNQRATYGFKIGFVL